MNIGPMGNGQFDPKDLEILTGIGKWMDMNSESIYGTDRSPLALQTWGVCTQKKDKLYLHVFDWPVNGKLIIGGLKSDLKKAYLLNDPVKKSLQIVRINPLDLSLTLPAVASDSVNTVIVLETKSPVKADSIRLLSGNSANRLLVFDTDLHGEGFRFGDGKTNRYYVENWKQKDQTISWELRLNEPKTYKVSLTYLGSKEGEGKIRLESDNVRQSEFQIKTQQRDGDLIYLDLGIVSLTIGNHQLKLEPVEITKTELMKPLEINLIPVE